MSLPVIQGVGVSALTAISPGATVNNSLFVSETMTPAQVEYQSTPIGIEGDWWFTISNDTFEVWHKTPEQAYPHYTLNAGWNLAYESVGINGGSTGTDFLNNNAANVGIKNYINAVTTQAVNEATSVYTQFISASIEGSVGGLSAYVSVVESVVATSNGFLSGKYTLTVGAGNVVTGMTITSATGPGTLISDVTFNTLNFKIYNGTLGIAPFSVIGSTVYMANATVSGIVDIGSGASECLINTSGISYGNQSGGTHVFMGVNGSVNASVQWFNSSNVRTMYIQQTTDTRQDFLMNGNAGTGTIAMTAGTGAGEPVIVLSDGTGSGSIAPGIINCYASSWTGNASNGHWLSGHEVVGQNGSIGSPGFGFLGDITSGIYLSATGIVGISGGLVVNSGGFTGINFAVPTGTPASTASPSDYVACQLNGANGYIPWYAA